MTYNIIACHCGERICQYSPIVPQGAPDLQEWNGTSSGEASLVHSLIYKI